MHRLRRQLGSLAMGGRLPPSSPMTVRPSKGSSVPLSCQLLASGTRHRGPAADFRAEILGEVRSSGPAPPAKLTSTQQRIFEGLLSAHGGDLEAMARDKKLNPMLLTVGRLRKMLLSYEAFRDRPQSKTPFRTPHKRLW